MRFLEVPAGSMWKDSNTLKILHRVKKRMVVKNGEMKFLVFPLGLLKIYIYNQIHDLLCLLIVSLSCKSSPNLPYLSWKSKLNSTLFTV